MEREQVQRWLDAYVEAWKTYDPERICDLFSEDVEYRHNPFSPPVLGRAAVATDWLRERDEPGTYEAHYEPLLIDGDRVVAMGRSTYYTEPDGEVREEYANIFVLRFDDAGRCREYLEWWMARSRAG